MYPSILPQLLRQWHVMASLVLVVVAVVLSSAPLAHANDRAERQLEAWKSDIEQAESMLVRTDLKDEEIEQIRDKLEGIRTESLAFVEQLSPELAELRKQLDQLGPAPEDGSEVDAVAQEREQLTERLNLMEGIIRQLEVNALKAAQVSGRAANILRTRFLQRVFEPSSSILNPSLWVDGVANLSSLMERLTFLVRNWLDGVKSKVTLTGYGILALAALAAIALIGPVRVRLLRWLGPRLDLEMPSDLERIWRVVSYALLNVLVTIIAVLVLLFAANRVEGALTERIADVVSLIGDAAIWLVLIASTVSALAAPGAPNWRLPPISNGAATMVAGFGRLLALVYALHFLWSGLAEKLFLPVGLTAAQGAALATAVAILLLAALWRMGRSGAYDEELRGPTGRAQFLWLGTIQAGLWLVGALILAALVAGYISLSAFLAQQLVITGLLVITIYLLHHLADEIFATGLMRGWVLGNFLRDTVGMTDRGVERLSLLLSTVFDLFLFFVGVPLIILQWAVTWVDLKSWLSTAFFGFRVGDVTVSLSTILISLAVLIVGLVLTRLATHWLDQRFLSRTRLDRGIRNSIKTATGYVGFIIAAMLAVGYAGLDYTNLAIVFGALSVGIGFGLQSIFNNFVSGLILLAERPIRVGDWISVAGEDGYVTKINVRSTEIETFDRSTVVVPNADFITGTVKNWTSNQMGRVKVAVGVSYGSDPEKVRDLLLSCAEDHSEIRHVPAPYVVFMDFGASSLDFELRCFVNDVETILTVASDLRFRIFKTFAEAGVEIPFPQRDLNIRDPETLGAAIAGSMGQPPAGRTRRTAAKGTKS